MKAPERCNLLWPFGTTVTFVDAYGRNPVKGKIIKFYGETNVLVEDGRGVTHFGSTDRIVSPVPSSQRDPFDDLLGEPCVRVATAPFEDLLG